MLTGAIGLLVFLILFQQSLQNGLLTSFIGGVRNQTAPVLVFAVDGQRFVQGSVITPANEALILGADGIGQSGRLAQGTFTVRTEIGVIDASMIGYEQASLGAPSTVVDGRLPDGPNEAVVSDADASNGFAVGDIVTIEPGGLEVEIVGLARDVQLNAGPSLFVTYATYVEAIGARNADAGEPLPNVIALGPADGVTEAELVANVNALSDDLDALTRGDAADKAPGVAQVRSSFLIIFLLYGLVVPCVTGLFFLIITFQKANSLTLLRAVGAPAHRLVASLLVQVVAIVGVGYLIGLALYLPVSSRRLGGIPLRFETEAVAFWAVALMGLGIVSSLLSARRVLSIDPIEATTGTVTR